jgi:hypothetical protein
MVTPRPRPPPLTPVENVAYWEASVGQWVISRVRPGTTTKVGLADTYLNPDVWPQASPPSGMRVVTERPT